MSSKDKVPSPTPSLSSSSSASSTADDINYSRNIKRMLNHLKDQISKDGKSQLQRLLGNIDNPQESKPMKGVSLGELNSADLYFIIVAIIERRVIPFKIENRSLKIELKNMKERIVALEDQIMGINRRRRAVIGVRKGKELTNIGGSSSHIPGC
ncbi:unnamed protein product [Dracunculus medinensis]|uniref:Uncharacterized protein n=1 Tax=Dracunculus medinensis TaxID=318479 RepID=A0A0N4UMF3_DRAME|nr:unnamed protein product [Dracunculus medinensis]